MYKKPVVNEMVVHSSAPTARVWVVALGSRSQGGLVSWGCGGNKRRRTGDRKVQDEKKHGLKLETYRDLGGNAKVLHAATCKAPRGKPPGSRANHSTTVGGGMEPVPSFESPSLASSTKSLAAREPCAADARCGKAAVPGQG